MEDKQKEEEEQNLTNYEIKLVKYFNFKLFIMLVLFVLCVGSGVYSFFDNRAFYVSFIFLSFLVYNGFILIYDLVVKTIKVVVAKYGPTRNS